MRALRGLARLARRSSARFAPGRIGPYLRRAYFWREVEALPVERFKRVLDAGCGSGAYVEEFARRFPAAQVFGIDLHAQESWRAMPPNCRLVQGDLRRLPVEADAFDLIWSIDVLEHVPENVVALRCLVDALAPGGFLYLHVPYDRPDKRILPNRLFRRFEEWAEEEHVGLQRSLEAWRSLLEGTGLQILHGEWTFGFWGELAWEIDQLTEGRPNLRSLTTPLTVGLARMALRRPASPRRSNVMLLARDRRSASGEADPGSVGRRG